MIVGRVSEEPTRITNMIKSFLAGQSGSLVGPPEGPAATLVIGADARDDCAVFTITAPASIVIGADYVRGAKFILYEMGLLSDFDIGYYLVAANLSDIAAMGATPIGMLTVVRYPPNMDDDAFHDVLAGIHQACTDAGTLNIGGDIGAAERLILSGTALGITHPGRVLGRSGAQPGDLLCLTGPCGVLGAAVAYFPRKGDIGQLPERLENELIRAWKRPRPRVAEGRILGKQGLATSCQDTSDGLRATIEQIGAASGVGFDIDASEVPVVEAVRAVSAAIGIDPLTLSMSASSDFQLVFTIAPDRLEECAAHFESQGLSFLVIGQATPSSGSFRMVLGDSSTRPVPGVPWRHQNTDIAALVVNSEPDEPERSA